jgi:hypothetical protein
MRVEAGGSVDVERPRRVGPRFLHSAVDELFSRAVASFELRAKLELALISEAGKIELELGPSF